jgi:plastocyanin domain-containing protein
MALGPRLSRLPGGRDQRVQDKLPFNVLVVVVFTPRKSEFTPGCGMDMIEGNLIV